MIAQNSQYRFILEENQCKQKKKIFFREASKFASLRVFLDRLGMRVAQSSRQRAGSLLEMTFEALPSSQIPADTLSSPSSCTDDSCMMCKTDQQSSEGKKTLSLTVATCIIYYTKTLDTSRIRICHT